MAERMKRRVGMLLVISGPSGVGKSTITHRIEDEFGAHFSVMKRCAQSPGADEAWTLMSFWACARSAPSPMVSATAAAAPALMM